MLCYRPYFYRLIGTPCVMWLISRWPLSLHVTFSRPHPKLGRPESLDNCLNAKWNRLLPGRWVCPMLTTAAPWCLIQPWCFPHTTTGSAGECPTLATAAPWCLTQPRRFPYTTTGSADECGKRLATYRGPLTPHIAEVFPHTRPPGRQMSAPGASLPRLPEASRSRSASLTRPPGPQVSVPGIWLPRLPDVSHSQSASVSDTRRCLWTSFL